MGLSYMLQWLPFNTWWFLKLCVRCWFGAVHMWRVAQQGHKCRNLMPDSADLVPVSSILPWGGKLESFLLFRHNIISKYLCICWIKPYFEILRNTWQRWSEASKSGTWSGACMLLHLLWLKYTETQDWIVNWDIYFFNIPCYDFQ